MKWEPKSHERDRFYYVYIDESSQTKVRYLVLGALIVPYTHSDLFDADVLAAREGTRIEKIKPNGQYKVMKWQSVDDYSLDAYVNTVDVVYGFKKKHNMPAIKDMRINCLAVDTQQRPLHITGEGDRETGYEKEFYVLSGVCVAGRFRDGLFRVHPDRRYARKDLQDLRGMMNAGAAKHDHRTDFPFRHLSFGDPETCLGLQVVDIFMGALAYKLNRHYEKPDANAAKKKLCDHIWQLFKLGDPFRIEPRPTKHFMNWMHRPGIEGYKRRPFQNDPIEG